MRAGGGRFCRLFFYMATIDEILEGFETFDLIQSINVAVAEKHNEVELIILEQMRDGRNGFDQPIGKYKNDRYASKKAAMNSAPGYGVVDLFLTGAFYQAVEATATGNAVVITSKDRKTEWLAPKYGDEIFKLGGEAWVKFINLIRPLVIEDLKRKTRLI